MLLNQDQDLLADLSIAICFSYTGTARAVRNKYQVCALSSGYSHYPMDLIIAPLRGSSRPEGPKAGPKGHKLEVGARRPSRLLVFDIAGIVYGKCLLGVSPFSNLSTTTSEIEV